MSYILDALDKAEQERQHTRAPNLKTAHTAVIEPDRIRTGLWITVLTLVALAMILVLYQSRDVFWPQPREQILVETSANTIARPDVTSTVPKEDMVEDSLVSAEVTPPISARSFPELVQPEVIEPSLASEQQPVTSAPTDHLNINDLPASVQRKIPDLSFSTHIYASDAAWRMVGINGRSRREGDHIEDNLVLQEITEQGVILEFEGYSFTVSVVKNWSSD